MWQEEPGSNELYLNREALCAAPGPPGPATSERGAGRLTFGAHEAPAHVDVRVVPLALPGGEVVRADDAVGCDHRAARGQTRIPSMVGDGAPDTPQHLTWSGHAHTPHLSGAAGGAGPPQAHSAAAEIPRGQQKKTGTRVG